MVRAVSASTDSRGPTKLARAGKAAQAKKSWPELTKWSDPRGFRGMVDLAAFIMGLLSGTVSTDRPGENSEYQASFEVNLDWRKAHGGRPRCSA